MTKKETKQKDTGQKKVIRLTRADILKTKDEPQWVNIDILGGEIPLVPLSDGEWAQIENKIVSGLTTKASKRELEKVKAVGEKELEDYKFDIDIAAIQQNDYEADCMAVAFCMADGEKWTVEDVKQIKPPGAVEEIAKKIYDISGVSKEKKKAVKSFRKK